MTTGIAVSLVGPVYVRLEIGISTDNGVLPVMAFIRPGAEDQSISDLRAAADEYEPDLRLAWALGTLRAILERRGWTSAESDASSPGAFILLRREQRSERR